MKPDSASRETHFLGWDVPLLRSATQFLADRYTGDSVGQSAGRSDACLDLRSALIVLPSARSADSLARLLHQEAEQRGVTLELPDPITVGQLPEQLYSPPLPLALELEQTLAWARVLQSSDADQLRPLIPTLPEADSIGPWVEFGGTLRRLHEDLAANRLSFDDVANATDSPTEQRRWQLLAELFRTYLQQLRAAHLADPHVARQQAIESGSCRTDQTIVLVGTSDLTDATVAMLDAVTSPVIALVAAPPGEAGRFDRFGCVNTGGWLQHQVPIVDDQLVPADDVTDQAVAMTDVLDRWHRRYAAAEVTIGVTDESHVGPAEVELRGRGHSPYRHLGWTLAETAIGRLMELIATHLRRRSWQSLAALVRHADVSDMVSRQLDRDASQWLTALDELLANHYPVQLAKPLPVDAEVPLQMVGVIDRWLNPFDRTERSVAAWSGILDACLEQLYRDRWGPDDERRTARALRAARQPLQRFASLNQHLDLSVDGAAAMEMLTSRLSDVRFGAELRPDDVQIAGWLDLVLDPAPAMIVIGLNHPFVPSAVTSDPFLPGALRTRLRMSDNDRRFARDVYALHLLTATRRDCRFIVGRFSADGSPTPPSRLLAAARPVDAARRVRRLLKQTRDPSNPDQHRPDQHRPDRRPQTELPIPQLDPQLGRQLRVMSVTSFRDYLICPYRFYLRHVLKLRPLDDAGGELAANQFGDLIHDTLEAFGKSAEKDEPNAAKIQGLLWEHLQDVAHAKYGDSVTTAVKLQVEQARLRLQSAAQVQSQRVAAGWRIEHAEKSAGAEQGCGIDVDGRRLTLRGRFDRIDFHPASRRWAILDYKTHGFPPIKKHLQRVNGQLQWIDLQLPLYRRMIPFLGIDADPADVELGYFNISQKESETKINIADFGEALMSQADQVIDDCVRRIWAGDFAATETSVRYDDYGMILQTGVASRMLALPEGREER